MIAADQTAAAKRGEDGERRLHIVGRVENVVIDQKNEVGAGCVGKKFTGVLGVLGGNKRVKVRDIAEFGRRLGIFVEDEVETVDLRRDAQKDLAQMGPSRGEGRKIGNNQEARVFEFIAGRIARAW